jgi:hypothetical protein
MGLREVRIPGKKFVLKMLIDVSVINSVNCVNQCWIILLNITVFISFVFVREVVFLLEYWVCFREMYLGSLTNQNYYLYQTFMVAQVVIQRLSEQASISCSFHFVLFTVLAMKIWSESTPLTWYQNKRSLYLNRTI